MGARGSLCKVPEFFPGGARSTASGQEIRSASATSRATTERRTRASARTGHGAGGREPGSCDKSALGLTWRAGGKDGNGKPGPPDKFGDFLSIILYNIFRIFLILKGGIKR